MTIIITHKNSIYKTSTSAQFTKIQRLRNLQKLNFCATIKIQLLRSPQKFNFCATIKMSPQSTKILLLRNRKIQLLLSTQKYLTSAQQKFNFCATIKILQLLSHFILLVWDLEMFFTFFTTKYL